MRKQQSGKQSRCGSTSPFFVMTESERMRNLRRALYPKVIAVVGVSADEKKYGHIITKSLLAYGYEGELVLVNPKPGEAFGRTFYPTVEASGTSPDLVVTALPADRLVGVIDDCARAGVGGVVIFTAGLAEASEAGAALQESLVRRAAAANVRLIGPNCLGLLSAASSVNVMGQLNIRRGHIGLVSQSGTIADIFCMEGRRLGAGLSLCVALGNQADVDFAEIIDVMAADDTTKVIVAYVEGVRDGCKLLSSIRSAVKHKPVVVIKGGRTAAGARSTVSHTASLAGSPEAFLSLLESGGAILVEDMQDLYPVALTLSVAPFTRGRGVAVIGAGGGLATLMSDALERRGVMVSPFPAEVQARMRDVLLPRSAVGNPVDFAGASEEKSIAVYQQSVELAMQQDSIHAIMIYGYFAGLRTDLESKDNTYSAAATALCELVKKYRKPLVMHSNFATDPYPAFDILKAGGIPYFRELETAARSLVALVEAGRALGLQDQEQIEANQPPPVHSAGGRKTLPFFEAATLLSDYGVTISSLSEVADAEAAAREAQRIGYPLVLKLLYPVVPHKTEVGGVAPNIIDEAALLVAVEQMAADPRIPADPRERRFGIGPMVKSGVEAVVGALRDPTFGPLLMVGSGGIFIELFGDVAFDVAGLDEQRALALIKRTKLAKLMGGARGRPAISLEPLSRTLLAVSELMLSNPQIMEVDLNPIFVGQTGAIAADVRVVVE
ncbi:acetate--CoA ligase family protein [Bradyrhizobium elkanii]|uniref:acetate--CoA ligase family protein n=1 Tax=Bradyrhizobium elkanii TaxID=29448 RepID=UPI001BAB78F4|nr:acetate--CoA ligase family protein [Bradyrhizobium elkanii]MBR1165072.1 acetate--CoA ligase family protein [Bradyrhizobium elkanii]